MSGHRLGPSTSFPRAYKGSNGDQGIHGPQVLFLKLPVTILKKEKDSQLYSLFLYHLFAVPGPVSFLLRKALMQMSCALICQDTNSACLVCKTRGGGAIHKWQDVWSSFEPHCALHCMTAGLFALRCQVHTRHKFARRYLRRLVMTLYDHATLSVEHGKNMHPFLAMTLWRASSVRTLLTKR